MRTGPCRSAPASTCAGLGHGIELAAVISTVLSNFLHQQHQHPLLALVANALERIFCCFLCRHCLEAHARAGMLADISTVHEILAELLPDVLRGESVESLRPKRPWPKVELGDGHTGLWWDVQ